MHVDSPQEHPEELLDRAIRGELCASERALIDRHISECPMCALELEGAALFRASVVSGKQDQALHRVSINRAMERLQQRQTLRERLRRWIGTHRTPRPWTGLAALGAAATVAAAFVFFHAKPAVRPPSQASALRTFVLDDGSEVTPTTVTTAMEVAEQTPMRTTVRLRSGSAQFRVRHDSRRLFRVDTGTIEIEDLGTAFSVAHEATGKIRVAVAEGRVAVVYSASGSRTELGGGESRTFDSQPEAPNAVSSRSETPNLATPPSGAATIPRQARATDEPAALLHAADLARRSHNPQAAVLPLRRLVERFPKDPRAPSAAFTLGLVLLTDLGRPREAAAAFAEAERHAPGGVLAEDAASRVVEAWQRAGDSRRASQAARHYEKKYPTGRHVPLMRALAGEP